MLKRILIRFLNFTFIFFNKDFLTFASITPRKDMQKIGTDYGGWFLPVNLINQNSIVYCAGCGEDISFDLGVIDRFACNIYAFDPTPKAIHYVNKIAGFNTNYHFFDFGLWDKDEILKFYVPKNPDHVSHSLVNLQNTNDYISVKVKRLSEVMKVNNHSLINVLKLDIEGAEYKVLNSIIEDDLNIDIICVEYDEYFNPLDDDYKSRIIHSVNLLLSSNYRLVHSEGNGNYTFVKNKLL